MSTHFHYNSLHHELTIHATRAMKVENILYALKKKIILQNHADFDPLQNKTQNLYKFDQSV